MIILIILFIYIFVSRSNVKKKIVKNKSLDDTNVIAKYG